MIRSKIAMGFLWALVALGLHVVPGAVRPVHAQGSRKDDIVFNSRGVPLAGATVRVCAMPASGQPCTPLALIYSDAALTQALANPTTTDGLGNYFFYAAPGKYEIEISGPAITTKQIPNVILPNDPSSPSFTGAVSAFSLTLSGNLTVNGSTTVVGNLASGTLNLANQSTPPGSAGSGTVNLYTKTADKRLYYKDDTGTETGPLGAGAQTNVVNTFTANQNFDGGLHIKGPDPYSDFMRYGGYANVSPPSTTASCTSGSTSVTLAAALDFQDASSFSGTGVGNGIVLYKCGAATGLTAPPAPTVTPQFVTGGATTYNYKYVAEDFSGGLTAASAQGSTSTGAATLGVNTVTLTGVVWNSTLNGEQVYTCSANCNIAVNAIIRIDGFTNVRFNGNYTVIAQTATTFTVYSPALAPNGQLVPPAVTSESASATVKLLACNILTMPLNTLAGIETGGDNVLRYWVYRNNTLAFVVQSHDPYYEDCGMNMDNTRIPSYVPSSPGSAVNKYIATTIVSGGGTTSIVVANAAGNTTSGQTALHDNSQNLLAATNVSHFSTPVYANLANAPFNAATIFTNAKAGNTEIWLPSNFVINQPWVVKTSGIVFRGGQNTGSNQFQFDNLINITGGGSAYPVVILTPITPNASGSGIQFKNINFGAPAVGQTAFVADFDGGPLFGLQMDVVGFSSNGGSSNVNTPAAVFKNLSESAIGKPGNRNSCNTAQNAPGPVCMRFTNNSAATIPSGNSGNIAGGVQVNGFAVLGGGTSYQFDDLPSINSGVTPIQGGAGGMRFVDGLREVGKGPFLRIVTQSVPSGPFNFNSVDDDAPNASLGNGFVDAAYSGNQSFTLDFQNMTGNVTGQAAAVGNVNVTLGPVVIHTPGTTGTAFSGVLRANGTGSVTANGTATAGYGIGLPNTPTVVLGAAGSCSSNCVAAGTYVYGIVANDIYGHNSLNSLCSAPVTTDGTKTITVSWLPIDGQVTTQRYRSASTCALVLAVDNLGSGVGGTSYIDSSAFFYVVSGPISSNAQSASAGSLGLAGPKLTLTNGGFSDTLSGTLTANRTQTIPDNSGVVPVTSYLNSAYDNFKRANGAIGSNWTIINGGFNITSNQVSGTAGGNNDAFWNAGTFDGNQFSQFTIITVGTGNEGPEVRMSSTGGGQGYRCTENSTTMFLQKMSAGGWNPVTSVAVTAAAGDILRMEAAGSTLTCYQNAVNVLSTTDTSYSSGSPGIDAFSASGVIANWSGGNLHPLAQLDTEQDWTKTQHFTQGVALGTETFTASPRSEQNVFLPGALTSTWTGATWTTDKAVTITRVQVQAKTAPAGCTTSAIVRLTDGTTPVNVTISAAANDSGVISQNYVAGSSLQVLVQTAAAGCTTSPADANVTVQYRMQ